jgi:hypothetical protein
MRIPGASRAKKAATTAVTVDGETVELRRPHKYGARRTEYAGQWYDSALEAAYARTLDARKAAGLIAAWCRGDPIPLVDPLSILGGPRRAVTWRADFFVADNDGGDFWVDCKGVETVVWRLKMRLLRARYPDRRVLVVGKDGRERWV